MSHSKASPQASTQSSTKSAWAFAPATVGNVAVGFDILGFALHGIGDQILVEKQKSPEIKILSIKGVVTEQQISLETSQNTATLALQEMQKTLSLDWGFKVKIKKGIPLASGLGGSAASAVGAVVAANQLLKNPLKKKDLLSFALAGEKLSSPIQPHADNVAPCLLGGMQLTLTNQTLSSIKVPKEILCVVVHPDLKIETKIARKILKPQIYLEEHIKQSAHLAGFIIGCMQNNLTLIKSCLSDHIIEPQREKLVPGFLDVKNAALNENALGCSLSGSGPSVFAWAVGLRHAKKVLLAMKKAFSQHQITTQEWISPISTKGAFIIK